MRPNRTMRLGRAAALAVALTLCAGLSHAASTMLREIEDEFVRLGQELRQVVVNIDVKGPMPGEDGSVSDELSDMLREHGIPVPEEGMPPLRRPRSSGSGFIYDPQGHIVTSNHVIEGADIIEVRLWNGDSYTASVVGQDPQTDIAVVKIEPETELPAAVLGDSDVLNVGQFAIAVGNPRKLQGSLSFGHVTALGRELRLPGLRFQDFIQTDAAINLGNSGGPLCDIEGRVIGINTAIMFAAESLGFAVPVNNAKRVVPELIAHGRVTRGYLGVKIVDADDMYAEAVNLPDNKGAFVDEVHPETPAAAAGIEVYDVIRKVNGEAIEDSQDLVSTISSLSPDAAAVLEIWRDGTTIEVEVKLDEFPSQEVAKAEPKSSAGIEVADLNERAIERLDLRPGTAGVLVSKVTPGSPADEAGLRVGDVITEVNRNPVDSVEAFHQAVRDHGVPGKPLMLRVVSPAELGEPVEHTIVFRFQMPQSD